MECFCNNSNFDSPIGHAKDGKTYYFKPSEIQHASDIAVHAAKESATNLRTLPPDRKMIVVKTSLFREFKNVIGVLITLPASILGAKQGNTYKTSVRSLKECEKTLAMLSKAGLTDEELTTIWPLDRSRVTEKDIEITRYFDCDQLTRLFEDNYNANNPVLKKQATADSAASGAAKPSL